jgi:hypothetical protein
VSVSTQALRPAARKSRPAEIAHSGKLVGMTGNRWFERISPPNGDRLPAQALSSHNGPGTATFLCNNWLVC